MSLSGTRPDSSGPTGAAVLAELACFLAPLGILAWALRQPLASLGRGLWGAADPWSNGDFVGNFWCWWRQAELLRHGEEWLDATGWPSGGGTLDQLFPNRVDAWMALPFFELDGWWSLWNGMAVAVVAISVVATVLAARLAGATRLAAATGALLLALSPTFLHELGWGRMASFLFWPGLLAMACAALAPRVHKWRAWAAASAAGALLSLQVVAYPFHAVAAGLIIAAALGLARRPWRHRLALGAVVFATALILALPWLATMSADFSAMAGAPPPAGYTSLPGAGLLGLSAVPERFRLLPLALPLAALGLGHRRARPWAVAGLLGLGLALGPGLFWLPEGRELPSPLAALMALLPWLERMHHPVRAAPLALGALAVATALMLSPPLREHRRWLRWLGVAVLWTSALCTAGAVSRVTTYDQAGQPPGVEAARWLAQHSEGPVVDLHPGGHVAGLALQPWHRQPLMESVQGYAPASGGPWSPEQQALADRVRAAALGEPAPAELFHDLQRAGYRHLLLVERGTATAGLREVLESRLGPPAYASEDGWIWSL